MKIVVHGGAAAMFSDGIEREISQPVDILRVSEALDGDGERAAYANADIIIGGRLGPQHPTPKAAKLFQTNGAGWNAVDPACLPEGVPICNCHGHPEPISEYIMAGLLMMRIPIVRNDALLHKGDWDTRPGKPREQHGELFGSTLGVLGFGQIAKDLAQRARAFGMLIHVCNRSDVSGDPLVDAYYPLDRIADFCGSADAVAVCAPLSEQTEGIVGAAAFAAMPSHAVIVNVGRGEVIEEKALYDALKERRIAGAVIDTWYVYPKGEAAAAATYPGNLPFNELDNIIMTPHMSGWTAGTAHRRRAQIAENIRCLLEGRPLLNCVAHGTKPA